MSKRLCAILILAVAASGCSRVTNNQGYVADEELVSAVQPGVDNKESVQRALGRPTLTGEWNENVWYYVSRTTTQFAWRRPRPTEQKILRVQFAEDGTVAQVDRRGLEQAVSLTPEGDKTRTMGRNEGFLEELFGNIGTVGAIPGGGGGAPQ